MRKITIIVPAYNEEANLEALYDALLPLMDGLMPRYTPEDSEAKPLDNYDWEVLMVNDGSRDRTLEIMAQLHQRDPRFRYLNLSRNFGKENAMLAGFDYATGDAAVIIDADLQHPVATIPEMVYWWEQGYEDVYGKRLSRGRESWLRRRLSMSYYKMLQRSTRVDILPNVGDFRLLDRRALDALRRLRETQRYTKGMYAWIGFRKKKYSIPTSSDTEGNHPSTYAAYATSPSRVSHHTPPRRYVWPQSSDCSAQPPQCSTPFISL